MDRATATPNAVAAIPKAEARRLIAEINTNAREIRQLIKKLHDGKGWRALGYKTWEHLVEREFTFDRQHSYRLLRAAEVDEDLSPIGDKSKRGPVPEAQARVLGKLPREKRLEVYEHTERKALAAGDVVTAEKIAETAGELGLAREAWGARAAESTNRDYDEAMLNLSGPQVWYVLLKMWKHVPLRIRTEFVDQARKMTTEHLVKKVAQLRGEFYEA